MVALEVAIGIGIVIWAMVALWRGAKEDWLKGR